MPPKTAHNNLAELDFRMMVQIDMEMTTFNSNWTHCDYISTYLARTVSHNRPDSVLFANLLSSALNELLEITFRTRHSGGTFGCSVSRRNHVDRIELTFTCGEDERRSFEHAVTRIQAGAVEAGAVEADYISSLSREVGPGRDMLLLELVVSYKAQVRFDTYDDSVKLVVDLPLGGLTH
ncbi:ubiquinone biosynthesis methyltransferase UbiE [Aminobacter sp. AP02]|uniref:ubiquinone biosynthesis methyltransferase UbiE n=1 Tax=Aminobacter sp. AP02 TaxID=2135737 RepID=UPI000D6BFBE0|nr:ubiquinone biosynthesis methyltransferase UbiE [Aminobacter sp. AP02]PWK66448.1 hypothetical protein C8K44_11481 [Aminobacter sp. AP02]